MSNDPTDLNKMFSRARVNDRQINELVGLCRGFIADGEVSQAEAEYLQKWLAANTVAADNPVIATLYERVTAVLEDGHLDSEEAGELYETLTQFSGGEFELGELLKSSTLPLDAPPPEILFPDMRFCFTGTFGFGSRSDCEKAVAERGGTGGTLTGKTDYLVIGVYATSSWAHSSYGRKIEKAVEMKQKGRSISIIYEPHWIMAINNQPQ